MTSLQKAAATTTAGKSKETTKGNFRGSGVFETCFGGLDLSEFANNSTNTKVTNTTTSAAAQLMQTKAQEAQRAATEAREESIMKEFAAQKVREKEELIKRKQEEEELVERGSTLLLPPPQTVSEPAWGMEEESDPFSFNHENKSDGKEFLSKGGIYSALVQMHGSDQHGGGGGGATSSTTPTANIKPKKRYGSSSLESLRRCKSSSTKPQRRNALLTKADSNRGKQKGSNYKMKGLGKNKNKPLAVKKIRKTKY